MSVVLSLAMLLAVVGPSALDVPYFSQDELLCGGAAAAMLERHGGDLGAAPGHYTDLVDRERGGITPRALVGRLRERGHEVRVFAGTLGDLREQVDAGRPVLVLLRTGHERLHYLVVVGIDDDGVVVHDPADGPSRRIERARFRADWEVTGRWAALVRPARADPGRRPDAAENPREVERGTAGEAAAARVAPDLRVAIRLARADSLGAAAARLRALDARHPGRIDVLRALAGVHFRAGRLEDCVAAARRACRRAPDDRPSRRLLAAALHLGGRPVAALRQWNRLGEPEVGFVAVHGARHTRHRVVEDLLGLRRGSTLTPGRLVRARRRTASLPAVSRSRITWGIQRDGRARVDVHLLERGRWPDPRWSVLAGATRAWSERELRLGAHHLTGNGDAWTVRARGEARRRLLAVGLAVPGFPAAGWLAHVEGRWEEESYGLGAGADVDTGVRTASWRRIGLALSQWIRPRLWLGIEGSSRRREDGSRHLGLALDLGTSTLDDRGRARLRLQHHRGLGELRSFSALDLALGVQSGPVAAGARSTGRLGLALAEAGAPRWAWAGAGEGRARRGLLRAHPLLDDGVVVGPAFDRSLLHGGVEAQWWGGLWSVLRPGIAVFADAARPGLAGSGRSRTDGPGWLVDLGVGLRLQLPAGLGVIALDVARGVTDGASAVHLSLRPARWLRFTD